MAERGLDRPVPRLRARRARGARADVRQAHAAALRQVARRHARLEATKGFSPLLARRSRAATPTRPRRASTRSRASGTTPTGSPIARSRTSTRCPTTPTGSCGCRSPIRTTRGIRPRRSCTVATGATSTCRPAIPAARRRSSEVLAQKPAHWLGLWDGTFDQRRRRTGLVPAAERQRRQHPRDQRDGAHHERAHRRGVRPRARPRRARAAGTPTPTCSSRPITASCKATTA